MNLFTNIQIINLMAITGQQSWELLAWTMCFFLAAGTVVALAGALVRFLCKRAAPQIRYTVSLGVFATLAMLPLGIAIWLSPSIPVAIAPTPIVIDLADTPITMSPMEEPIELTNITVVETPTTEAVPFVVAIARQNDGAMGRLVDRAIEFLPWVWLIGTPLTFLLLATGLIGSGRLRRQCTLLTEGPIFDACERLRTTLAVSQRVGIAINERIATPLLIGIVRPLILLPPAALTGWSPDELEMVLLHELAHVRRWDNLVNFGQRLVESLLFFHPAVWWVSRWVRRDREECCDAVVVAQTEKPQAYAELLVALATPPSLSSPPLAGMAMAQHPLAGRIRRILHLEEEKMLITRSTLGLVGFFVVALLGIVLWQPATVTVAEETNPTVIVKKELTTEVTKGTEVANEDWPGLSTSLNINTSDEEINLIVEHAKTLGKTIHLTKNYDDTISITIREKGQPTQTLTARQIALFDDFSIKVEGLQQGKITQSASPFPTLEAQRSADLAYKLLHIELEPLNKEELERVKAMKFAGGLRVTSGKVPQLRPLLHYGDLLVGLHVWPTTSLADVKKSARARRPRRPLAVEVLCDSGSPEKQCRRSMLVSMEDGFGGEFGEPKPKTVDQLVTGRIEVNVDAMKRKAVRNALIHQLVASIGGPAIPPVTLLPNLFTYPAARIRQESLHHIKEPYRTSVIGQPKRSILKSNAPLNPHTLAAGDSVKVVVAGAYPDQPVADVYRIEEMGTLAFGPTYGRVKVAGLTLLEAEEKVSGKLQAAVGDDIKEKVRVQITLIEKAASKRNRELPIGNSARYQNKTIFHLEDETSLLYDGKLFGQWKTLWRRDLSIDLRVKAVHAFVAFANAGKGKEAVDEIMAIAAECDWTSIGLNGVTEPLQLACRAAFTERQLPTDVAVKAVIAAKDSKNARVRTFVLYTLQQLSAADQKANELLREAFPKAKLPTIEEHNARFGGGGGGGGGGGF